MQWEVVSWWVAGIFSVYAIIISLYLVLQHLWHYTTPHHQKHIVRICLMVPIYAFDSWLSLRFVGMAVYLNVFRDFYEAFALYSFFVLLVNYMEGEENIVSMLGEYG
tara:strand:+ start:1917 stop:2237 length:321 start_codon:yes stop_codon:yes gene_type:complete